MFAFPPKLTALEPAGMLGAPKRGARNADVLAAVLGKPLGAELQSGVADVYTGCGP